MCVFVRAYIILVYQQIEDTLVENDTLKIQLSQVVEERNSLQQHSVYYSNELSLLQSETSYNALVSSPLDLDSITDWDMESVGSAGSHADSMSTSASSIPVSSARNSRRSVLMESTSPKPIVESDRIIRKLRADLREVTNTAQVYY